jgi:hypothetical protein
MSASADLRGFAPIVAQRRARMTSSDRRGEANYLLRAHRSLPLMADTVESRKPNSAENLGKVSFQLSPPLRANR